MLTKTQNRENLCISAHKAINQMTAYFTASSGTTVRLGQLWPLPSNKKGLIIVPRAKLWCYNGTVPVIGLYGVKVYKLSGALNKYFQIWMVINAIGIKLLLIKTVAQCVKIKINQKFSPTNQFAYELRAAKEGPVSYWNQGQTSRQIWDGITFCDFTEVSVVTKLI